MTSLLRRVSRRPLPSKVIAALSPYCQSVTLFGAVLVVLVWIGTETLIRQQHMALREELRDQANNFSVVFTQSVGHTLSDLDRILKFVRSAHDDNPGADWASIVTRDYVEDRESLQISVLDARGFMISSSALPHPPAPVDLSDREHFRAHLNADQDKLFISRPVIGRVSGKPAVQFSRRIVDAKGAFAGVAVISLDPKYLARAYAGIHGGAGFGLAVVGDDGIVRAGAGPFAPLLGHELPASVAMDGVAPRVAGEGVVSDTDDQIQILRRVEGFPLEVLVSTPGLRSYAAFNDMARDYRIAALVLTGLALLAAASAAKRQHLFEQRIVGLAEKDALTGLPNRVKLRQAMEQVFALPPESRRFALHLIDLDGFKMVNDTHGHLAGDKLLQLVASRLRAVAPSEVLVARMGGDEFALLQPVENFRADSADFARRLIRAVSAPTQLDGVRAGVGVSVGIADAASDATRASQLLKAADLALYAVKADRRGSFKFFEPAMESVMLDRRQFEADLRAALTNNELLLHYQPIVDARSGEICGFEALLRWLHPQRGLIPPLQFIKLAEETGVIVDIGRWVIRSACAEAASWSRPLRVAVNISPRQFFDNDLFADVCGALRDTGLTAERLELEITELAMLSQSESTVTTLEALRSLGVSVAMDDFGAGYSTLSYLRNFTFDRLKIDRAFVVDIETSVQSNAIVTAIVALCADLDIRVTAEGVETPRQFEILRAKGCSEIQGYLISPPASREDIANLLEKAPGERFAADPASPRMFEAARARETHRALAV